MNGNDGDCWCEEDFIEKLQKQSRRSKATEECTSYGCVMWAGGCIENRDPATCQREYDQNVGYKG